MQAAADLDLEPDDDVIFRFLATWFGACNRGVIELGWTDERDGTLNLFRRFELADIVHAARFAAETNARPGASMYFRPATVRADTQFTRDADVVQIPGCWIDADTEAAIERVLAASIVPSMQIVTGRFPTQRGQFLWKFSSEPILVAEWSRRLNRQAQTLAGGDPAVINPSTLLRLPGSVAWPWKAGRRPELTEWVTPDGGGGSVSLSALQSGLPPVPDDKPASPNGATTTAELLNPIQALIDRARAGPLWHDPVVRLVAMLVSRGVPDAAILAIADHLTWRPRYTVTQTRVDLAKMIEGAKRKGFDPGEADADDVMDVPAAKDPPTTNFQLLTAEDVLALPDPEWLIPDVLAADTFSVLYGQFRSFKSFVALDWALCLATGTDWCGRAVKQCDVLYVAGEGVAGLKLRIAAWRQHHGIDRLNGFRVIPLAVNLMDKADSGRLIQTATEADGFTAKLVIVDTLHRSMPGAEENSAKDVGLAVSNAALIQRGLGCGLLAVHHAGKDAERGLRGSSGLPGAADTIVKASRAGGGDNLTLAVEKQKDAEDGQSIHLRTQLVHLQSSGSVKPLSSLVLIHDDDPPIAQTQQRLTQAERRARQFLADLVVAEGEPLPPGGAYPSPVNGQPLLGVPSARWREECETRRLSAAGDKKNRSTTFRRVYQTLLDKAAVAARDDLVWLA